MLAIHDKIGQTAAAECSLDGRSDIGGGQAQVARFETVDRKPHFGFIEFQVDVDILESGVLARFVEELRQNLTQFVEIKVL
ncbi:hypothetical protein D3C87_1804230 [compost metagenome]